MHKTATIRSLTDDDLPEILMWRNHPRVRNFMFTQHEISPHEHRQWFAQAAHDATRRHLIIEVDRQAIGFVQFSQVSQGGIADWGFYTRPDAPKGSGRKLGGIALNHAFMQLQLHKVCGQAIAGNQASIALHLSLGFTEEGVLRDQQLIDGAYHALHCFGLLASEWQPY